MNVLDQKHILLIRLTTHLWCFKELEILYWNWIMILTAVHDLIVGGVVASWLVHLTPVRAVWVRALAGDIVLWSWARHLTLMVPLSTQVYKWVPVNLMLGGNPAMDKHPIQGGVEILLVASCYRNRVSSGLMGHSWLVCRLYLTYLTMIWYSLNFLDNSICQFTFQTHLLQHLLDMFVLSRNWVADF